MNEVLQDEGDVPVLYASGVSPSPEYWYKKRDAMLFVLLLLILVQSISILIPPFQSPDEVNHIKRAYTLAHGSWLPTLKGNSAGGEVDTGLLAYTEFFSALPFDYAAKENRATLARTENIKWTSKRAYSDFSNTALYFPVPYLPQALALNLGENLHLPVSASYSLARSFSLAATLAVILCALLVYPVPLLPIAVFLLPMTLFQMASASMDSVCFSISLLAASLFTRGCDRDFTFRPLLHCALWLCLIILATVRQNLFCFTLLPVALYPVRRSKTYFWSAGIAFLLAIMWPLYLTHGVSITSPYNITPREIGEFYLGHPLVLLSIIVKTVTNSALLISWRDSFIGTLGGLDTPLSAIAYDVLTVLLILLTLITFRWPKERILRLACISLVSEGVVAILVLFFLMLVIWTPRQADFIQGVQGRYFVPILLLVGVPLFSGPISPIRKTLGLFIVLILLQVSLMSTSSALIGRYWLSSLERAPSLGVA